MSTLSRLITVVFFFGLMIPVEAAELWGEKGFHNFAKSLPLMDRGSLESVLGKEWTEVVFKTGLEPARIHKADFDHIDPVLEHAVGSKMGILELFTTGELADAKAPALLLDQNLLERIDAKYDLFSVWMLSVKPTGAKAGTLKMRYMIVGQGILIVGYPHAAPVEIIDDGKSLEYQYEPVISAKIVNTPGTRGLFGVKTLASPKEEFGDFKGPMGVSIRAYEIKGSTIRVEYHLVVDQETLAPKKPIIIRGAETAAPSQ